MNDNREKKNSIQKYGSLTKKEDRLARRKIKEDAWQSDIERVYHGVDKPLLVVVILLIAMGAITLLSASYPYALANNENELAYFKKTIFFLAVGMVCLCVIAFVPKVFDFMKKATPFIYIATVGLLGLVLVAGKYINGARRRFDIGGVSIQPSEIAKLALILIIAWYFDRNMKYFKVSDVKLQKKKLLIWPAVFFGIFAMLILLEKHLSCIVIMTSIFIALCVLVGVNFKWMALYYGIPGGALCIGYLALNPYAVQRIITHTDSEADTLDEAWQTAQSLLAIGNGGLLGTGFGQSNLKFSYISEPMNDFIFAVYCEEMGFVGAICLLALFGLFVWRGMKVALHAKDIFSQLTAFGITMHIGLQAVFNIMVVTDLFPNTGISLPFFSFGGSALIMQMVEVGILLAISRHSYIKKKVRR